MLSALRHLALDFRRRGGNRLATETRLHNANQLFFRGIGGRGVEHDFAGMQKVNTIAYLEHLVVVVDDQNNRHVPLSAQVLDQLPLFGFGFEPRC